MADSDVIVAGAGIVGVSVACALADSGLEVVLLERTAAAGRGESPNSARASSSASPAARVSALSLASRRILESLDAWDSLAAGSYAPFREMRVWDAAGWGEIHFDSAEMGLAELGWIVDNDALQAALWRAVERRAGVRVMRPANVTALSTGEREATVQLQQGQSLSARLLVGADGAGSKVRELANIAARGWGYQQQAVVATVRTELMHRETAWQRFLPQGPLAFLPLADGQCSIVWSTSPSHATALLEMAEHDFLDALGEAFGYRLGDVLASSERASFPLRAQFVSEYIGRRLALLGDAAHVVHPLAGQGLNLGLLDAAALAETVTAAAERGGDCGAIAALRRYQRWRKGDNLLALGVLDGFKRLFGARLKPFGLLRNAALNLADATPPLKYLLARRAMGMAGELPRLARQ